MKAFLRYSLTLVFVLVALASVEGASALRHVAVIPFDVPSDYAGTQLAKRVADMITSALIRVGGVEVIESAQLDAAIKEHNLKLQGVIAPESAKEAGRVLGVDCLIGGKITEFGIKEKKTLLNEISKTLGGTGLKDSSARVVIDFRLLDVKTARVLLAKMVEGSNDLAGVSYAAGDIRNLVLMGRFDSREWRESRIGKATDMAVGSVVDSLLQFFPPVGRVLSVFKQGEYRYAVLDLGSSSGMKIGQEFNIYREHAVRDSDGREVWREKQDIGRVRIEDIESERCKAVVIDEEPAMAEGDLFIWKRETAGSSSPE